MDFSKENQFSSADTGADKLFGDHLHQAAYRYANYRDSQTKKPLSLFRQRNQEKILSCLRMK